MNSNILTAFGLILVVALVASTPVENSEDDSVDQAVVLSSDNVGVFCLPNSTESEKNFYVIRDQKALESVQKYRSVVTS